MPYKKNLVKFTNWVRSVYFAVIGRNIIATTSQTWEDSGDSFGHEKQTPC